MQAVSTWITGVRGMIVINFAEMCVPGDDFVNGEYNAFHVVSLLFVSKITYAATIVEVEQHKRVCLGVDKKISSGDILVSDAVLEVQVVNDVSQLSEPLQLKRS